MGSRKQKGEAKNRLEKTDETAQDKILQKQKLQF